MLQIFPTKRPRITNRILRKQRTFVCTLDHSVRIDRCLVIQNIRGKSDVYNSIWDDV